MKKILVVFLLTTSVTFAQIYQLLNSPVNGGTRAFAMGGCFTATNVGIESMLGNPAGLVDMSQFQVLINGRFTVTGNETYNDEYYRQVGYKDFSASYNSQFRPLTLAIAVPFVLPKLNVNMTGAVGYRCYYDWNYDIEKNITAMRNRKSVYQIEHRGLLNVLTMGLGMQISERVQFGILYNEPMNSKWENTTEEIFRDTKSVSGNRADIYANNFFQFGGLFHITDRFSVGAAYYTGHTLEYKNFEWKANDGIYYPPEYPYVKKYEFPQFWSLGFKADLDKRMMVSAEIQSFPWEDYKYKKYDMNFFKTPMEVHAGLEFQHGIQYRLGAYTNFFFLHRDEIEYVSRYGLTGGVGFDAGGFSFDASGVYRIVADESPVNVIIMEDGPGGFDFDYRIKEFVLYLSCIYSFDLGIGF